MKALQAAAVVAGALIAQSFAASSDARAQSVSAGIRDAAVSAQQRQVRVRPRVRVYRELQPPFWEYPRPGVYSWPGPNAKRDCRAWYVVENRPSGAVMTPRMQCWWVPG